MAQMECPICKTPCEKGDTTGDYRTYLCGSCGSYRLGRTAEELLAGGSKRLPDPIEFRRRVAERSGDSDQFPLFTTYDFD